MAAKKPEKSFEEHLQEAEAIVRELESGSLPLEDSIARYEKAVGALKQCHAILDAAEKRIEALTRRADGTLETKPLEPPA
ncbi:MAG: exodeoxyribonuclease VII small subunit [Planctomycetes bacterium]|nr:exodeoxyribonuclease VII small subunit [Planctomycetota bacterium]